MRPPWESQMMRADKTERKGLPGRQAGRQADGEKCADIRIN